jgi:uncharacterized protein (DUF427 family)
MAKAIWNGTIIAESNETVIVEGNHYFPPDAINTEFFKNSTTHTNCHWKGLASYYNIEVKGQTNSNGAWYYPNPLPAASEITGYIAFWRGVKVED